ncbi:YecA family protein [Marinobacter sp.]|uniref:YecA/YgfB family protein n=1 Tax=Marinobacter sp. TaxID=50741 RepID=UPI00356474B1
MLNNDEIEVLEDILFAEPWGEESLDFFGLHGVVCASVVGPRSLDATDMFRLATGQDSVAADDVPDEFARLTRQLAQGLAHSLDMGQALELPEPEDGDPMNALENWCAGFVDSFLEYEDEWLQDDEAGTAELLVPMLTLSGLFDDEDFRKAREDEKVAQEMAEALPDALTDLYLHFHAPD